MEEIIIAVTKEIMLLLDDLSDKREFALVDEEAQTKRVLALQVTIEALRDIRFRLEELI